MPRGDGRTIAAEVRRVLRADLGATGPDPLPPLSGPRGPLLLRWVRWMPHGLVLLTAALLASYELKELTARLGVSAAGAVVLVAAQSGCVLLALFRPLNALWFSLTLAVVVAVLSKTYATEDGVPMWPWLRDGPWPWPVGGILAHALVLLLLALRVRVRVAAQALMLSLLVGPVLEALTGDHPHMQTASSAALAFAVVVLVGASMRGRRVAGVRLVEQEVLTAEERTRRTILEERSRIARELHDVVAHHMSVISIQAQVAPHLVEDPPEELRENLAAIRRNAVDALTELRRVLGVLRAEEANGTAEAAPQAPLPTLDRLDALLDNARAAGLDVTSEVVGERRAATPGVELSAYRIVQEALSNALRHAPGGTARVELSYSAPGLRVRVTNTAGTQGSRVRKGAGVGAGAGHGLLGMRERTAMLGGELATGPTPDGGYEVSAFLPTEGERA
ncbi:MULTISPECIES: sensor histidine kinase [Streptomyces]|uniref:histidine kinase n=1 Tax=Streptomyces solicathayae TaxID=3081768 RepID=A0ABZ0LW81_9ACTN|nr:histidine kinase [Streptomyces sp. HUAS YS2]WOX23054.1 histidine kinase [Streptomyces sp. HUAS YS2]